MKFIDKNGRLFGKISIIDVAVILAVAVMAFALHQRSNRFTVTASPSSGDTITFSALAENLPGYVADAVAVGDKVYDNDRSSGGAIGVITAVERMEGSKVEELPNGTFARLPNADGYNLLVTVECKGVVADGRYSINRVYELGVNANRSFYTPYATFLARVTEIGA